MKKYIGIEAKMNEIRLLFRHPSYRGKIILIVEGVSDVRLYRKLFNCEEISIESISGKDVVVRLVQNLVIEYPKRILGICDADFDHLTGIRHSREPFHIFVTDCHDAESYMLESSALSSFIDEFTTAAELTHMRANLLSQCRGIAYEIGIARLINAKEDLSLKFSGMNFSLFCSVASKNITFDVAAFTAHLFARSPTYNGAYSVADFVAKLHAEQAKGLDVLQVCCGHDVTSIISLIYREPWASLDTGINVNKVESTLRAAYPKEDFLRTSLCVKVWTALETFGAECAKNVVAALKSATPH